MDISSFISKYITQRKESLFLKDLDNNTFKLYQEIKGKTILVIGGAGTIGSSFIKALLPYQPYKLVVVDISENELTELTRDLRSDPKVQVPEKYVTYPFDYGSRVFYKMLQSESPFDIVANFAAHKHVRSEKDHFAIEAMLENNIFKNRVLLEKLKSNPPKHFFCVSTDKATNPVNVMGASKQLMEELLMAYAGDMKITTARFANVAFSNGSLLYGYRHRMQKKQPLSCPSDVKRYFVSPEESGQLCLLACILGDAGDVFFPKLETSSMIYFKDITDAYIQSCGLKVELCESEMEAKKKSRNWSKDQSTYPVYYFKTDTSGEKLFEEFYTETDQIILDDFEALGIIKRGKLKSKNELNDALVALKDLLDKENYSKMDIIQVMQEIIPSFRHVETGKSLDEKM